MDLDGRSGGGGWDWDSSVGVSVEGGDGRILASGGG